ncbi:MAG: dihydropteroate synthase [Verrucomicrobiota bacterium]
MTKKKSPITVISMAEWKHHQGTLQWDSSKPLLMGILNVTPDSFSDGGKYNRLDAAVRQATEMVEAGASLIDIGGESTRPGANPVDVEEESRRVLPVIGAILSRLPETFISIDTYKAEVARQAVDHGAVIVNDISAGRWDAKMSEFVAKSECGYVCMHSLDRPQAMQRSPAYDDASLELLHFLKERKKELTEMGIEESRLIFDVGIGFGKTLEHNLQLIRSGIDGQFDSLDRPLLWGLSRKSFLGAITGADVDKRLAGGLAAHAKLLNAAHAQIWRVHDVREVHEFMTVWHALDHSERVT